MEKTTNETNLLEEENQLLKEKIEQLKRQIIISQKYEALGIMASSVSHEAKNLLNIIWPSLELIQMQLSDNPQQTLGQVIFGVKQIMQLLSPLIDFSRNEVAEEKVYIPKIVKNISGLFSAYLKKEFPRIKFETFLNGSSRAMVKHVNISQITLNLLHNSVDSLKDKEEGLINLRTDDISVPRESRLDIPEGNYTLIEVADNGIGLNPEEIGAVFDIFSSGKTNGHGIGMHVVQEIVKRTKGFIEINSQKHIGTKITVYFPASH